MIAWAGAKRDKNVYGLYDDYDILIARTRGLFDHAKEPLPAGVLDEEPTPHLFVIKDSQSEPLTGYVNNLNFPETLSGSTPYAKASDNALLHLEDSENPPVCWSVPNSNNDSSNFGSAAIFHMPVVDGTDIKQADWIRKIEFKARARRDFRTVNPPEIWLKPSQVSLYVFKGGNFDASHWNDPQAWECVMKPTSITDFTDLSGTLELNFANYLNEHPDTFGGATGSQRPAHTLTWAIFMKNADNTSQMNIDYAKLFVYPKREEKVSVASSIRSCAKTRDEFKRRLVFYADCGGTPQAVLVGQPWGRAGAARLTYDLTANSMALSMLVSGSVPAGAKVQILDQTTVLKEIALDSLVPLEDGLWKISDITWFDNPAQDLLKNKLLQKQFTIQIVNSGGTLISGTSGTFSVDSDDDGLTDDEENGGVVVTGKTYKTNPLDRDSDDDGLLDGEELLRIGLMQGAASATDPGSAPDSADSDPGSLSSPGTGDGLADGLERGLSQAELDERTDTTEVQNGEQTELVFGQKMLAGQPYVKGTRTDSVGGSTSGGKSLVDEDTRPAAQ